MGQLTGPTVDEAAADVCRDKAHHLEHEPELDVLRAVRGSSSAIAGRAESAIWLLWPD
jgi:hypothetical protein